MNIYPYQTPHFVMAEIEETQAIYAELIKTSFATLRRAKGIERLPHDGMIHPMTEASQRKAWLCGELRHFDAAKLEWADTN
jgi:hypothetical protein